MQVIVCIPSELTKNEELILGYDDGLLAAGGECFRSRLARLDFFLAAFQLFVRLFIFTSVYWLSSFLFCRISNISSRLIGGP